MYRAVRSLLAIVALALFAGAAQALSADREVDRLLAAGEAPPGVVFEVIEGREDALGLVLPAVRRYVAALRSRWPELDIAVVSHGNEEFGLTREAAAELPEVHSMVQQLGEQKVPVHVCEAYATMKGVGADDFPAYVSVSPHGPSQVADYESLGYVRIRVDLP